MAKKKKKSTKKSEERLVRSIKSFIVAAKHAKGGSSKKKKKSGKVKKNRFKAPEISLDMIRKFVKSSKIGFMDCSLMNDGKDKDTDDPGPRMMINGKKSRHH